MIKDINILKSLNILYAEDDLVIKESTTRILKMFFKEVFVLSRWGFKPHLYRKMIAFKVKFIALSKSYTYVTFNKKW